MVGGGAEVAPWKNIFIRDTICSDEGRKRLVVVVDGGGDFGGDESSEMSVKASCQRDVEEGALTG